MSIEERLRGAIDQHVGEPVADDRAWASIQRRIEDGTDPEPKPRHERNQRILAAAVAVLVFGVVAVGLGLAIHQGRDSTSAAGAPPAWLVDKALQYARMNGDPAPASAEWVLADGATVQQAFGYVNTEEPGSVYVVILHGEFTANGPAPPGAPPSRGSLLFLVVDPASHNVTDWGVGNHDVSILGLAPLSLTASPSPAPSTTALSAPCASENPPPGFIGVWLPIPFVGAKRFPTLAAAQEAAVGDLGSLPRSQDTSASDGSIADVWIDPTKPSTQVCIDYTTGIKVEYDPAITQMLDPSFARTRFEQMAREDAGSTNGQARFVTIPGPGGSEVPGELIPDGAAVFANGASQGGPGFVSFVASRYVVDVVGHEPSDALTRIAASVLADTASN